MPAGKPLTEIAWLLALATLWGASFSFIAVGVQTISPITLIAARTLIAGLLLTAFIQIRGLAFPRDRESWRNFTVQAVLNSAIPFTLIAWAQQQVDASVSTILNSTSPIFAFLITWAITRHEKATPRKFFGVLAGLIGIALIVGMDAVEKLGAELLSQLALVAAAVSYSCAAIFGKRFDRFDPAVPAAGSLLCGAVMLVPASFLFEQPLSLTPSTASVLALLALSVFSTSIGLVIYFRLLRTLGSIGTTAQAYLRVPIGVAIAVIFLGDKLSPTIWAGLACVVVGIAAMTLPQQRSKSKN